MFNRTEYEQLKESLTQAEQFFNSVSIHDGQAKTDSAILNLSAAMSDLDSYLNRYKGEKNAI